MLFFSSDRVILLCFVNVDLSVVDLGPQTVEHALDAALVLPLHVLVVATRVCYHLLQVDLLIQVLLGLMLER